VNTLLSGPRLEEATPYGKLLNIDTVMQMPKLPKMSKVKVFCPFKTIVRHRRISSF
jgi:hypothetical protein